MTWLPPAQGGRSQGRYGLAAAPNCGPQQPRPTHGFAPWPEAACPNHDLLATGLGPAREVDDVQRPGCGAEQVASGGRQIAGGVGDERVDVVRRTHERTRCAHVTARRGSSSPTAPGAGGSHHRCGASTTSSHWFAGTSSRVCVTPDGQRTARWATWSAPPNPRCTSGLLVEP